MTHQEKYNELRTRINKHCPYLMELRLLQDVLREMGEVTDKEYCIEVDAGNAVFVRTDDEKVLGFYDLTKPLSEQSEETLDFLLEVVE